jgi:hypothetical protein
VNVIKPPDMPNTPECVKLREARDSINTILRFLEFLITKDLRICARDTEGEFYLKFESDESLIHEHLGIDARRLENERRALLDYQRQLTERSIST